MSTHLTIESAMLEISNTAEEILRNEISKKSVEKLKESIQENVYDTYLPLYYERTFQLRDSAVSVFDDNYSNNTRKRIMVYNDTGKAFMPDPHPSWVNNRPQRSSIPLWMNNGTNSPLFSHPVSDFINEAYVMIDRSIRRDLIEGFKKRGYIAY